MRGRKVVLLLILVMAAVSLGVAGIAMHMLYDAAFAEQRARLVEMAQSQARLIEGVARFDAIHSRDAHPEGPQAATLSQIVDAHKLYEGFGETGEFTLARRDEDQIVFLLSHRHYDLSNPKPIPFSSQWGEPMRRALSGLSGTVIGLDYRGVNVLAAYEPVEEFDWGIVAKIDLAEVRAPFVRAGIITGCAGLVMVLVGAVLFFRIGTPVVQRLEESEKRFRSMAETTSDWIWETDRDSVYTYASPKVRDLLGYEPEDVVGKTPFDFMPADEAKRVARLFKEKADTRESLVAVENTNLHRDGHPVVLETSGVPILDRDGKLLSYRGIDRDITDRKRAEETLRESEERYRTLAESAPDSIYVIGADLRVEYVNTCAAEFLQSKPEEITGKPLRELFSPAHFEHMELALRSVFESGAPFSSVRKFTLDGRESWLNVKLVPLGDAGGQVRSVLGISRDVTEAKQAEEALRQSELELSVIYDNTPIVMLLVDRERRVRKMNVPAVAMARRPEKEAIGLCDGEALRCIHARDDPRGCGFGPACETCGVRNSVLETFRTGKTLSDVEACIPRELADGPADVWVLLSTALLQLSEEDMVLACMADITHRKRTEEARKLSHHLLEITNRSMENVPLLGELVAELQRYTGCAAVGIRILDEEGNIPYEAYTGFSDKFYRSESPLSIKTDQCMCINVVKGDADPSLPYYTEGGSFYMNGTTRFLATVSEEEKGATRNVCNEFGYESVALVPIRLLDRVFGLIHVADTSEDMVPLDTVEVLEEAAHRIGSAIQRVWAEEALRQSQRELAIRGKILEIFLTTPDERMYAELLQVVRETFESEFGTFGYFNETGAFVVPSMTRQVFWEKCNVSEKEIIFECGAFGGIWARALEEKRALYANRGQFNTPPGHIAIKNTIVAPIIYRDRMISAIHLANKQKDYNEQDRALLETICNQIAPVLQARLDRDRRDEERKQAEEALRRSESEWEATFEAMSDWVALVDTQHRIGRTNRSGEAMVGVPCADMLGQTCCSLVHGADEPLPGCPFQAMLHSRRRESAEQQLPGEARWLLVTVDPVLGEDGDVVGGVHIVRDITERKQAEEAVRVAQERLVEQQRSETQRVEVELDKARDQLVAQTRLATIGQISASIAHDLRNPLGTVRNAVYYLRRRLTGVEPQIGEYLDMIDQETTAADGIIANLMSMIRSGEPAKHAVDLGRIVHEVLDRAGLPEGVRCRTSLDPDPFTVRADAGQLRQIITNLVRNAVQALDGRGEILVTATRSLDHDTIVLQDDGPGILPNLRERIFDPLFTTRTKGTGLGLTICRQIIERHGGTIEVVDHTGRGASFRIRLPR